MVLLSQKSPSALLVSSSRRASNRCRSQLSGNESHTKFEETALTLVGRKRPYITHDKSKLRTPQLIPSTTSLYVESNLSSNYIAKLCYTLVVKMGYPKVSLTFEVE